MDFVKLFLDNGLSLKEFLTKKMLQDLYGRVRLICQSLCLVDIVSIILMALNSGIITLITPTMYDLLTDSAKQHPGNSVREEKGEAIVKSFHFSVFSV